LAISLSYITLTADVPTLTASAQWVAAKAHLVRQQVGGEFTSGERGGRELRHGLQRARRRREEDVQRSVRTCRNPNQEVETPLPSDSPHDPMY
jgi:hypothetical protein